MTTCDNWYAWIDTQPVRPPKLMVVGDVSVPSGGYSVALEMRTPQGFNPSILLLDLIVTPPPPGSIVTQAFVCHQVRFERILTPCDTHYTSVTVHQRGEDSDEFVVTDLPVVITS